MLLSKIQAEEQSRVAAVSALQAADAALTDTEQMTIDELATLKETHSADVATIEAMAADTSRELTNLKETVAKRNAALEREIAAAEKLAAEKNEALEARVSQTLDNA